MQAPSGSRSDNDSRWDEFRREFALNGEYVHMSALFIASHPTPVRDAIAKYRDEIDADPALTLQQHNSSRLRETLAAAARYLGVDADEIALTDSTTMGIGLIYNGLRLRPSDEILTTEQDYYVTHEAVRQAAARSGSRARRIDLYRDISGVAEDQLVDTIVNAIQPNTRVVALTWVHSSTGLKLPLRRIGERVRDVNAKRDGADRVLLSIDGVHGFGVEDVDLSDLQIDFFAAGCHKWLFGPRGTGILWANERAWRACTPLVPSFIDDGTWEAWMEGDDVEGPTTASRMTPGGFKAFEHQWAMAAAFDMHRRVGKSAIQERTHELAAHLKDGLRRMSHIRLVTPVEQSLSSGLVCFDVQGLSPWDAVARLRRQRVVATVTPYAVRHVRLAPSIRNTHGEIDRALEAVRKLS